MARPQQRANLGFGLKLDLNQLIRNGSVRPGCHSKSLTRWVDGCGDELTWGLITNDMTCEYGN